ncbi:MAG: hypothetical protein KC418_07375, partial [Anaerolineales bacterium]|nr:hypothetical protein [Anaerolineales bacterium]
QWEPLLQSIAAAAREAAGQFGREEIEELLPQLEAKGWMVREAVQRIWAGERDAAALTANIDGNSAALVNRILAILAA